MAYAQWVEITIKPVNFDATLQRFKTKHGKFYDGSKDNEVTAEQLEGMVIKGGMTRVISACGRDGDGNGTTGHFEVFDGDVPVGGYHWSSPFLHTGNVSEFAQVSDDYFVSASGGNFENGALGNVLIEIAKR